MDGLTRSVQSQARRLRDGLLYTGVALVISLSLSPDAQALQLYPATLDFQAVPDGPSPPGQIVTICQDSTNMVIWISNDDATWVSVQPTMGMMASSTQVLVSVNPAGLHTGPYTATVTITTADGESIQIPVTLAVMSATSNGPTNLSWGPSISTDVAGYCLYIGTAPGIYSFTVDVGMVTSYTLSNLEVGNTYYFAVRAYDSRGIESDFSNVVSRSIY